MQRAGPCLKCESPWPLRLSQDGEVPTRWICVTCGSQAIGLFDDRAKIETHRNVRLSDAYFDYGRDQTVPAAMKEYVAELAEKWKPYEGRDKRRSERVPKALEVSVVSFNESYTPLDESFAAIVSNISQHGLALVHTRSVDSKHVAVEISSGGARPIQVIARVVRCGAKGRFYEVGCDFVARLGD